MELVSAVFLFSPIAGLLACMLAHLLLSRSAPTRSRLRCVVDSVIVGLGVVVGMALTFLGRNEGLMSSAGVWATVSVWVLTYLGLTYCYVFGFFCLGETARRIRLLVELDRAGERGMTLEEVLTVYNGRMIVEARLQRLLSGGQIMRQGDRYLIRRRLMLLVAKAFVVMKLVLLRARSEFGVR